MHTLSCRHRSQDIEFSFFFSPISYVRSTVFSVFGHMLALIVIMRNLMIYVGISVKRSTFVTFAL